ncbi:ankyrin repeat domain-containing protein [Wolbachia endosymbiont (group E) of Neria commutata]|uniref:host RNA manipulator TomO n=1 Tax=Wolbachia endosymbiont (group E) of Neria commutata TaxID=3066149 RepID=UPI003132C914
MFGSNFRDFVSQDPAEIKDERLTKSCPEFGKSDSGNSGNCSETEEGKSSDREAVLTPQDDNSLIQFLIGNIGEGPKSFIIEDDKEESFVTVPKNLTFTEMTDILNSKIDDIQDYENRLITDLGSENFRNFCSQQLNLDLQGRSDHQHIYSNILSMYKRNMENGNHGYSVKELLLLAIAANDDLAKNYQNVLFAEKNLSILPLLVGGEKYIEIFIEKFPDLYQSLKEKTIKTQCGQVNFFSAIALRKESKLFNGVFFIAGGKFQDLKEILQQRQSISDSLYGIFETASLVQNIGFINIVLNSIKMDAKDTNDQDKKDLFKSSFITLLASAISQEHASVVEHLCTRCTKNEDPVIQQIYKEAFADDKVIQTFDAQIISKIKNGGNNGARKRKEEVYNLILKTASQTGNIEFITEVLKLIENDPQLSNDQDKQVFLQDSLITILGSAVDAKSAPIIKDLCTRHSDSIIKALENKEGEEVKKLAAKNILNSVEKLVQNAVEDKDVSALSSYVNSLESSVKSAQHEENLPIVKRIHEIVDKFAKEHDKAWSTYVDGSAYAFLQKTMGYISHGEYKIVKGLIARLSNLRSLLENKKNITTPPVAEQLISPVAANSAEPKSDSGEQAGENVLATLGPAENNSNLISNNKGGVMGKDEKRDLDNYLAQSEARVNELQRQNILHAESAQKIGEQFLVRVEEVRREAALRYYQKKHGQTIDKVLATGEENHVDPNVTIPENRKDSGCGSGSSTPEPETPAAVSGDHFIEDVVYKENNRVQPTRPSGSSTPEIPEKIPVLNDTHTSEASDEKQIINDYNKEGFTPLHVAAQNGNVNEGKRLIRLGANIEDTSKSRHSEGNTALHLAAKEGHKDFVELLLNSGADVNSVSSTGSGATPLHEAAYYGRLDVVKLLIERGAKINAGDRHNDTPLKYASAQGNSEVVLYLLQKGADLYLQSKDGETALHSAAEHGHPGVASILIDAAEDKEKYVNVQSHCVGTALHIIAYNREINEEHKKVIKLLLDNVVCPYLENNPITNALLQNDFIKENSLSMAIMRKNTEFIEFMTSLGYPAPPQVTQTKVSAQISGNNAPGTAEPDQNAQESKLPLAATLAFTATGAGVLIGALSMYFVLDASLLATGIVAAIGVCYLAAAVTTAIVYCCKPKSSGEYNSVTDVGEGKLAV